MRSHAGVGNTTSGYIRASVIDGFSCDYKIIVPHGGCYGRAPMLQAVNLSDMASKYAEVVSTEAALALLRSIPTRTGAVLQAAQ